MPTDDNRGSVGRYSIYRSVIRLRIKKISNNKIVVQLTDSDLKQFDLDFDKAMPQAVDLHNFLFEVMEVVQNETGFDPYHGGQVVVEASPSEEGISLVISKIKTAGHRITREEFRRAKGIMVKQKESVASLSDLAFAKKHTGDTKCKDKDTVFVFDGFDTLESAMCNLADECFDGVALYRNNKRYAVVARFTPTDRAFNVLSEYAAKTVQNSVCAYDISEGWTLVACGGELKRMAENIRDMM